MTIYTHRHTHTRNHTAGVSLKREGNGVALYFKPPQLLGKDDPACPPDLWPQRRCHAAAGVDLAALASTAADRHRAPGLNNQLVHGTTPTLKRGKRTMGRVCGQCGTSSTVQWRKTRWLHIVPLVCWPVSPQPNLTTNAATAGHYHSYEPEESAATSVQPLCLHLQQPLPLGGHRWCPKTPTLRE